MRILLEFFAFYLSANEQLIACFAVAPSPYLPPLEQLSANAKKYTLVLDLDETLVHYTDSPSGGQFLVRPHCKEFLREMSNYYEIVVFTAAM